MNAGAQTSPRPGSNFWRYVWKLSRLRVLIFLSSFRRGKPRQKFGMIVLVLLVIIGMAAAFVLSWFLLKILRSPELVEYVGDTTRLINSLPGLVVTAAFIGIFLTSFGLLLQSLYLAGDMDFLLSTPTPIRAVFVTKMLQAILPNLGLILLFGLPVLYGLGASGGYNFLYYPLVVIVLSLLALAAAGIASLLVMAIVRVVPARRVAEVIGFFSAIMILICSQSGNLMNYINISSGQATQAVGMMTSLNSPWSPLAWAGRGLVYIGEGRWLSGLLIFTLTVVLTGGIFFLSLWSAERLYYTGWASVQVSAVKKKAPPRAGERAAPRRASKGLLGRMLPGSVSAIVTKDFLMLRRDLRNLSQVLTPMILGVMYAFILLRSGGEPPAGQGNAPPVFMEAMRNMMDYANVAISLFVGWSLLGRLAGMGFSQEGKSYWMLKSAPVSTKRLLAAKFIVAYLPSLAMVWGFLIIISLLQKVAFETLAFGLVAVALIIAGAAGLNLAFGVLGARFDWVDPRRMSSGSAGCFGALASMIFFVVSLGFFFGPALLASALQWPQAVGLVAGLILGGALSLAVAIVPLVMASQRVPALGEES